MEGQRRVVGLLAVVSHLAQRCDGQPNDHEVKGGGPTRMASSGNSLLTRLSSSTHVSISSDPGPESGMLGIGGKMGHWGNGGD